MVHWVCGWGAECNGINSALGRKPTGEVEIGQDAPAEDLILTLHSHVGILSFMDFFFILTACNFWLRTCVLVVPKSLTLEVSEGLLLT